MVGRSSVILAAAAALAAASLPTAHAQPVQGGQAVQALASHVKVSPAGTVHLKGNLDSTVDMTMNGAFSFGHAESLSWDLPAVVTTQVNGFAQQVNSVSYTFSVSPSSAEDLMVAGAPIHRVTWTNPPANTVIEATERVNATISSSLNKFSSTAGFPMTPATGDAATYLATTPDTTLPAGAQSLVQNLVQNRTSERAVVEAVMNYVAATLHYSPTNANTATDAYTSHTGTCEAYANLAIAMLRSLGIPAQAAFGWVSAQPITLKGKRETQTIQWGVPGTSGELHVWVNVYFSDTGWVPFDPQLEKFFIDPRHIAYLVAPDATNLRVGSWSASYGDASPTGAALSNGSVEIVPGVGGTVTLKSTDHFNVSLGAMTSDMRHILLYSRSR
jgi:hypothetical protein